MRQSRRGAPYGWLLALLFPLLVSGGLGGSGVAVLLGHTPGHPAVTAVTAEHQPLSHQVHPGGERQILTVGSTGSGSGGGHPVAARPPGTHPPLRAPGAGSRRAGDDDPRPLAAPLFLPSRAPPSTGV
ncbi:hypothetical protein [Streptosporangium sp. NBC_01756]|uniref:hypothetical protein n=1 Tax=Streptosporangium sp. NBC_01756 TaxID=2975950 RepID=UPI002DD9A778|nr:hypothetical protein [Streptosporangium sp. NBC_01756]WSC89684.1 hypothetical protein OIE48_16330 [Streptosporangium sp. NBC_01756]